MLSDAQNGITWQEHEKSMVWRAFGTPHRAGLMSRSVSWLSSTPRPRRELPLWLRTLSLFFSRLFHAPRFVVLFLTHHSSIPFTRVHSLLRSHFLLHPLFLPVRSPISFTLAQRPFFHPLAPGVPLLSSAMSSTCRSNPTRFYRRPILSAKDF